MGGPVQGHSAGRHWNPKPSPRAISDHPGRALTCLPSQCHGAQILAPPPWVQIPALALLKAPASYSPALGFFLRKMDIVLIGLHPLQDYLSQYTQNAEHGMGHGKAPDTCPPSTHLGSCLLPSLPQCHPPPHPAPAPLVLSLAHPGSRLVHLQEARPPGSACRTPRPTAAAAQVTHTHTHTHTHARFLCSLSPCIGAALAKWEAGQIGRAHV